MIKYLVIKNLRGTCSSVEMLKGYMARERLGTPGLAEYDRMLLVLSTQHQNMMQ